MESPNETLENLLKIEEIVRKGSVPLFFQSVAFLFDNGVASFLSIDLDAIYKHLDEKHDSAEKEGEILIMTRDYEKAIVRTAYDLAQFPLFDLLLYIKRNMNIDDPQRRELTNIYTGKFVGEVDGNLIRTKIGTFHVNDRDLEWLITTASS